MQKDGTQLMMDENYESEVCSKIWLDEKYVRE
jgi:hypothetical protein